MIPPLKVILCICILLTNASAYNTERKHRLRRRKHINSVDEATYNIDDVPSLTQEDLSLLWQQQRTWKPLPSSAEPSQNLWYTTSASYDQQSVPFDYDTAVQSQPKFEDVNENYRDSYISDYHSFGDDQLQMPTYQGPHVTMLMPPAHVYGGRQPLTGSRAAVNIDHQRFMGNGFIVVANPSDRNGNAFVVPGSFMSRNEGLNVLPAPSQGAFYDNSPVSAVSHPMPDNDNALPPANHQATPAVEHQVNRTQFESDDVEMS